MTPADSGATGARSGGRSFVTAAKPVLARLGLGGERRTPEPIRQLSGRLPVLGVLGAALLAGLLFGPTFGSAFPSAILVPVLAVVGVAYVCFELARLWSPFEQWRALASTVLGLLAIVETTLHGTTASALPTGASLRALYDGARRSWLLTLQSTLPARPDAKLVVFVPLLVLVAATMGVQVLVRTKVRLLALLPSLLVAGLSQAFHPLTTTSASLVVLGFAAAAAAVLGSVPRITLRVLAMGLAALVPAVLLGTLAGAITDPVKRGSYSLQQHVSQPTRPIAGQDPLTLIPTRLSSTDNDVMFTVKGDTGTDRWPIEYADTFDGANWKSGSRLQSLGTSLPQEPPAGAPVSRHHADIDIRYMTGARVPTQDGLTGVSHLSPEIDETSRELVYPASTYGTTHYQLSYTSLDLDHYSLTSSTPLTPHARNGAHLPAIYKDVVQNVADHIGKGASPNFGTVLRLRQFFLMHFRQSVRHLPAGHDLPKLSQFLTGNDRQDGGKIISAGTSEQFATAFVLVAWQLGIPARLAVGFSQPKPTANGVYEVREHNAMAWPEVSVEGLGWVPIDTVPSSTTQDDPSTSVAKAVRKAQEHVSPPPKNAGNERAGPLAQPPPPRPHPQPATDAGIAWSWIALIVVGSLIGVVALAWLLGVPAAKWLRVRSRRRRHGNSAIVSAWLETRDRLRDHGVVISRDMTVRDVSRRSGRMMNEPGAQALDRLADLVDSALWAGAGGVNRYPPDVAWGAYDVVRRSLAARPLRERIVAGLTLRSLRTPR